MLAGVSAALIALILIVFFMAFGFGLLGFALSVVWSLIWYSIVGLVIGGLGRLLVSGRQDLGLLETALFGIAGALLGGIVSPRGWAGPVAAPRSAALMLTNRSAPPATVTPVLIYPDVRAAVAWLESAFGFQERVRIGDAHRAQLRAGDDGAIVVADVRGEQVAPAPGVVTQLIKLRVPDVDAAFARACDHGARVLEEPTTHVYGERSCVVEDLAGHRWELTQTVRDVDPEEWGGTAIGRW
jgi:uncharacterized glyoxalase superfamily protein PhnB/uncharacterized membrane protein YeaQ/YmgE (transglycosylase-associated protein family)